MEVSQGTLALSQGTGKLLLIAGRHLGRRCASLRCQSRIFVISAAFPCNASLVAHLPYEATVASPTSLCNWISATSAPVSLRHNPCRYPGLPSGHYDLWSRSVGQNALRPGEAQARRGCALGSNRCQGLLVRPRISARRIACDHARSFSDGTAKRMTVSRALACTNPGKGMR